jgi:microcin C transport system substrate-binding protein
LICAFDFEWTNKNIMFDAYKRTVSVFQNSEMMATGVPGAEEIALLEPFRGRVSDEVFGEPFVPPVSDGSGQDRALLRKAVGLLESAGITLRDGKRVTPKGERITIEFLIDEPDARPHHLPFIKNLATLGIDATLRIVDPVQYGSRLDSFDYDIVIDSFQVSSAPGDNLRSYFSLQSVATKGAQNFAGIADPVIDALVDRVVAARTRPELITACKALDRVFRAGRYWIPHWHTTGHRIAYWDVFGRPAIKPRYGRGIPETWWYDRDKAAKNERAG